MTSEQDHVKRFGIKAENYFLSLMNAKGVPCVFRDEWYDFQVYNDVLVEVKSCQLSVADKNDKNYRVGRFDFNNKEETRDLLSQHNAWVCLIVRHNDQFLLLGFVRARSLNKKRYLRVHHVRNFKPLDFETWHQQITPEANA